MVPDYLKQPTPTATSYGTLKLQKNRKGTEEWIIEGNLGMIELAKRLFPGSSSLGKGRARFPRNKRNAENINWLMLRYPLSILSKEEWQQDYQQAVEHVHFRKSFNQRPSQVLPSPSFKGELKDFQKEGLSFLLGANRALLADEMGLGKTPQALAYLATKQAYPALIVVPSYLCANWVSEIKRFLKVPSTEGQMDLFEHQSVHVIKGLKPYELPPANIYIIHYLLLRGWKEVLPYYGFKTAIFDEIQELRHTKTEKYSAASLISSNVENCIGLSGTPFYNHGGEMWAVMNIIEFHCLGDQESFSREWCYGYGGDIVTEPQRLGQYLREEGLMLRREKKDVLKELPPKRKSTQVIDFDRGTYSTLIQDAILKAQSLKGIEKQFDKLRLTKQIVNMTRQAMGIAKAPYVALFVKMLLDAGEKVLLFAFHHAVYDIYQEELADYNPVFITGRENDQEKEFSKKSFMEGKSNLCILSLRACAGHNLQRATCVVFGELDWSPAVHSQAEDRAHRIGQEDSLMCYYLVAEEGSDEEIREFLGLKISQFIGIVGGQEESEEEKKDTQVIVGKHMQRIVEKLVKNSKNK